MKKKLLVTICKTPYSAQAFILTVMGNKATNTIRLNQWLAQCGVCSRRRADIFIQSGNVSVNNVIVKQLGTKIIPSDEVRYLGQLVQPEPYQYFLLNKPKGYITTVSDPKQRPTVMDLMGQQIRERIYPVGRLDRDTTGLLLFTNDGHLTRKLLHPSCEIQKIYSVKLNKPFPKKALEQLLKGFKWEGVRCFFDGASYLTKDKREVSVRLHIGKNRIIRRMFERLGYEVQKLDRVAFAKLTKKQIPIGKYRKLTPQEIHMLKGM